VCYLCGEELLNFIKLDNYVYSMRKRVQYIFFDFDGTISDAKRLTYETLVEVLDEMDFKISRLKLKKLMGAKMPEILKGLGIGSSLIDKIRKSFYRNLVKKANLNNLKLCCDIEPLWELKKSGTRLVVLSNAEKSFLNASIKVLGIKRLFYRAYGAHKTLTKDEVLKKLFRKFRINSEDTMYVGDRFSDIEYAHQAKMLAVAIHNKCAWSTKKEILAEKPDYIISNFEDLKKLVECNFSFGKRKLVKKK